MPDGDALAPCPPEIIKIAEAIGRMLARRDHAEEERAKASRCEPTDAPAESA